MKSLVDDRRRPVAVAGMRGKESASAATSTKPPTRGRRDSAGLADAGADQAREGRHEGAADRRNRRARQDRGEPESRLEGRAAGDGPRGQRDGQSGRRGAQGSAAALAPEPRRRRRDVGVPVGAGRRHAGARGAREGAVGLRSLVRPLRAQRGREEGRAERRERARAGEGRRRSGAGVARSGRAPPGGPRAEARRRHAAGHRPLAAVRESARAQRRAW